MLAQYYSLSGSVEYYIILYMKWIMNTINLCEEEVNISDVLIWNMYTVESISCISVYVAII